MLFHPFRLKPLPRLCSLESSSPGSCHAPSGLTLPPLTLGLTEGPRAVARGPRTAGISVTWGLVRNARSRASLATLNQTLWGGAQQSIPTQARTRDSAASQRLRTACLELRFSTLFPAEQTLLEQGVLWSSEFGPKKKKKKRKRFLFFSSFLEIKLTYIIV